MRLSYKSLLVLAVTCLILSEQNAIARPGRKCPGCAKHRRRSRKEHSGRGSRKTGKSERPSFALPQGSTFDPESLRGSDAQTLKYLEKFAKPLLLQTDPGLRVSPKKYPTNHYTEALVDATGGALTTPTVVGKFGYHSRHQKVEGRLVHVRDAGQKDSHFGCAGGIDNGKAITAKREPWVALISRGKCAFLIKIKLAEKFNASAVIVYDTGSTGDVEVMRTIGSRIPSLMVNATGGKILSALADRTYPTFVRISVGAINIQTGSDGADAAPAGRFSEAIVDFQSKGSDSRRFSLHKTTGMFGTNSPRREVSARVVHVTDPGEEGGHYGCFGRMSNDEVDEMWGEWIALIAQGNCNPLAKIMLAEKYGATAVVIYETEYHVEKSPVNAVGSNITVLTIDVNDGGKVQKLFKDGTKVYLDIGMKPSPRSEESAHGRARTSHCSIFALSFGVITALNFKLV